MHRGLGFVDGSVHIHDVRGVWKRALTSRRAALLLKPFGSTWWYPGEFREMADLEM